MIIIIICGSWNFNSFAITALFLRFHAVRGMHDGPVLRVPFPQTREAWASHFQTGWPHA